MLISCPFYWPLIVKHKGYPNYQHIFFSDNLTKFCNWKPVQNQNIANWYYLRLVMNVHHDGYRWTVDVSVEYSDIQTILKKQKINILR